MADAWEILERAGVPIGVAASDPELGDLDLVAQATRAVLSSAAPVPERRRVALLAWLSAWASDWPTSFRAAFGADADGVLARAAADVDEIGRYLKLRRVAREKLARVL